MIQEVFMRTEKKYILSEEQYQEIIKKLKTKLEVNEFSFSTICNVYFDNDSYELIRKSIDKPEYKEKVRIRSYVVPELKDKIFLEIKKKYKGIVYKRRIQITLQQFYNYFENGIIPQVKNKQIMKEIDYCFKKYDLQPKIFVAYDREAYTIKDEPGFRITFDKNLRNRENDLKLEDGDYGEQLLKDKVVLEVKKTNNMPLWFTHILSELKIYPESYSKVGAIYQTGLITPTRFGGLYY